MHQSSVLVAVFRKATLIYTNPPLLLYFGYCLFSKLLCMLSCGTRPVIIMLEESLILEVVILY